MKHRLLIYHGKHNQEYYLADTPERLEAAKKHIFTMLNDMGCYDDEDDENLEKARNGNNQAIHNILTARRDCEYESWDIIFAIDPIQET